jgi:hypothetical protein
MQRRINARKKKCKRGGNTVQKKEEEGREEGMFNSEIPINSRVGSFKG